MASFGSSIVINRPIEEVFAYMNDPANDTQWQSVVVESKVTSEGPVGVGTTGFNVIRFLGRKIEANYEITEHEQNKKSTIKSTSGPIPFTGTRTFESVEGGTRVTESIEA